VEDILEVQTTPTQSAFFLKLKILEKSKDKPDAFKRGPGGRILSRTWTEGTFPVQSTGRVEWKEVKEDDKIQKLFNGEREYLVGGRRKMLFMVSIHVNPAY
jgi:hypothetical protein